MACGCRSDVVVLGKFDANGISILGFKKHAFANRVFTLMLVNRNQSTGCKNFLPVLQYLLASNSIDIIIGDLNYDLLKGSKNRLLDVFTDSVQMVKKPTHSSGSLIDHVYIKIF